MTDNEEPKIVFNLDTHTRLRNDLAKDIEEYHSLVNQDIKTFSWKIFADFLLSKGWTKP